MESNLKEVNKYDIAQYVLLNWSRLNGTFLNDIALMVLYVLKIHEKN